MSNIEEDIYNVKELIQGSKLYGEYNGNKYFKSIENILAEREQDRKRIKELEVLEDDLKDKRVVYIDTPEFAENYIPKQKVKDKIEDLRHNSKLGFEETLEETFKIEVLEELLEEK